MGIIDVFYGELNRFRDKLGSQEQKKEVVKEALKKALIKFKFLWDDQITTNIYKGENLHNLLRELSEDFLNLAIEVNSSLNDEEIVTNLREISKQFRHLAERPHTLSFIEVVTGEMVQILTKINIINKKLEE